MNYKLDIQRADVIRYFVLHKYGGVYMDLDIGEYCLYNIRRDLGCLPCTCF